MALIDVSELMVDPDFVDEIQILRRVEIINDYGEVSFTPQILNSVASVQPLAKDVANRLPEGVVLSSYKTFFCAMPIYADRKNGAADIIVYNDRRFQVIDSQPWASFGAGWWRADCVMEKLSE